MDALQEVTDHILRLCQNNNADDFPPPKVAQRPQRRSVFFPQHTQDAKERKDSVQNKKR
jgi:hypothetical protein